MRRGDRLLMVIAYGVVRYEERMRGIEKWNLYSWAYTKVYNNRKHASQVRQQLYLNLVFNFLCLTSSSSVGPSWGVKSNVHITIT
jgi:hypothetical protein